ncbi:putative RNA methyltransferase [Nonomuraea sp. NPDC000554]|uniref:putative RNA methyltransferase n=1 Tax=Nonomuraea sp. NPDC000554 TaxID=3154259 RepID=UPI0033335F1D
MEPRAGAVSAPPPSRKPFLYGTRWLPATRRTWLRASRNTALTGTWPAAVTVAPGTGHSPARGDNVLMLADIIEYLACPVCRAELRLDDATLRCAQGHGFDVAKQGYVSLLTGSRPPGTADTADMVAARAAFLDAGHYAPLAAALAETVRELIPGGTHHSQTTASGPGAREWGSAGRIGGRPDSGRVEAYRKPVVVDAGAGTGYYLANVLKAVDPGVGLAFDVSKHAIRRAARAHPRAGAFVADVWRPLPIRDEVADVVIDVFAPRNGPEFARILRPGGSVVVVTPAPEHLSPLVERLGLLTVDEEKERRVARSLAGFTEVARRVVEFDLELDRLGIAEVVRMGPSAWHTEAAKLEEQIAGYIAHKDRNDQNGVTHREKVKAAFHLSIFETSPRSRAVP